MSCEEQQQEEVEVLLSIYDGDENFKQQSNTVFQYKIGEDQTSKSFVLEISWGTTYPDELPVINVDTFYNKHLLPEVKTQIKDKLAEEAEANLGCAVTYTLFEYAKENSTELLNDQPESLRQVSDAQTSEPRDEDLSQQTKAKEKKEQLTKAQKRKMTNRMDNKGEYPRGYDWIDVVKHLSQTGSAEERSWPSSANSKNC